MEGKLQASHEDGSPVKSPNGATPPKDVTVICEILSKSDPVLFKDAILCLAADGLTHSQFELLRRAATSAMTRKEGCPFCRSTVPQIATKAKESKCRYCLTA